jgi:hypothetical protein
MIQPITPNIPLTSSGILGAKNEPSNGIGELEN